MQYAEKYNLLSFYIFYRTNAIIYRV